MPRSTILLVSANAALALKAAQCADAAGLRAEVLSHRALPRLRWSRRVGAVHVVLDDPAAAAAAARRLAPRAILGVDVWGFGLARRIADLAPSLPVAPAAAPALLRELDDKVAFVALAERLGVPVPASAVIDGAENGAAVCDAIGYPLMLKTRFSESSHGVFRADTRAAAAELLRSPALAGKFPVQVQRFLAGPVHGTNLLAKDGRVLARSSYVKLTPDVFRFGPLPAFEAAVERLVAGCGFSGLANFDAIETADGPVLLECNPRAWYNLQADALAGLNYVAAAVDALEGRPVRAAAAGDWTMPAHLLKSAARLRPDAFRASRVSWKGALYALGDPIAHLRG